MEIKPTSFARFYLKRMWRLPNLAMRSILVIESVLAVGWFVVWLANKQAADAFWPWLEQVSIWWFFGAIAAVFVHYVLVANHASYVALERRCIPTAMVLELQTELRNIAEGLIQCHVSEVSDKENRAIELVNNACEVLQNPPFGEWAVNRLLRAPHESYFDEEDYWLFGSDFGNELYAIAERIRL